MLKILQQQQLGRDLFLHDRTRRRKHLFSNFSCFLVVWRVAFTKACKAHIIYRLYAGQTEFVFHRKRKKETIEADRDGQHSSDENRANSNRFCIHSSRQGTPRLSAKLRCWLSYNFILKIWIGYWWSTVPNVYLLSRD